MKKYKGFLIDLDGTVYRGKERIEEAVDWINTIHQSGLPYLFVTNNSSKTPEQVAETLKQMGVQCTSEHVFTTSMATANYIAQVASEPKVFMIGEVGLEQALKSRGLELTVEEANVVVMGIDREVTYEKFAKACLHVRNGATFISTNGDKAIPTERGLLPGNGSLTSVVAVSTGVTPTFIGKPESIIIEQALERLGTSKEETLMIGDNYDTDIMAGIRAGIDTLIVHTGVTSKEDLKKMKDQPTYSVDSLAEYVFAEE
ncbi:TIGR01457 family HAD-type hydrolase [Alkalihalobacterium chitinilyticum]|uniref:Acid sugar phosphatase n=1 Tax=Alkalihalobacterium chitinilyticum TaxID=2980103 RepID=A0ABT5VIP2_9BACI|nr:TIGR01457 family HAD-type hydrolase [Alkalihalobacterium chitinilyticum]MDE5415327.1 TIGR01457 family HAD-type hydrolase [Alkalihalobacterium chitinilyticum]